MSKLQKNTYVTNLISQALIELLDDKELKNISITEITKKACVSRCSFYRNYENKEDIIRDYVFLKIKNWQTSYDNKVCNTLTYGVLHEMWADLFEYLKKDKNFYVLLQKRGLLYLVEESIYLICGPKAEDDAPLAFFSAFVTRGIYGWIEEWIKRDIKDEKSDEVMKLMADFVK